MEWEKQQEWKGEGQLSLQDLELRKSQARKWLLEHPTLVEPISHRACIRVNLIAAWFRTPSSTPIMREAKYIIDGITQLRQVHGCDTVQSKEEVLADMNHELLACLLAIAAMSRGADGRPMLPDLFAKHGSRFCKRKDFEASDFDWFTNEFLDEFNTFLGGEIPQNCHWIQAAVRCPLSKSAGQSPSENAGKTRGTTDNTKPAARELSGSTAVCAFSSNPASGVTSQPLASLDSRKRTLEEELQLAASKVPRTVAPTPLVAPVTACKPLRSYCSPPQSERRAVPAGPYTPYPDVGAPAFPSVTTRFAEAGVEAAEAKMEAQHLCAANAALGHMVDRMGIEVERLSAKSQDLVDELNKSRNEARHNELSAAKELLKVMVERDQARKEANKLAEALNRIDSTHQSVLYYLRQPVEPDRFVGLDRQAEHGEHEQVQHDRQEGEVAHDGL